MKENVRDNLQILSDDELGHKLLHHDRLQQPEHMKLKFIIFVHKCCSAYFPHMMLEKICVKLINFFFNILRYIWSIDDLKKINVGNNYLIAFLRFLLSFHKNFKPLAELPKLFLMGEQIFGLVVESMAKQFGDRIQKEQYYFFVFFLQQPFINHCKQNSSYLFYS